MSTGHDRKRHGRFIKHNDPLKNVMAISDFNLAEICETPITFHDNPSANIIHERLHLREDLAQGVRRSPEMDNVFTTPEERVVIRPLDFTDEWRRQRSRASSRQQRNDDDDDFDLSPGQNAQAAEDEASASSYQAPEAPDHHHDEDDFEDEAEEPAPPVYVAPEPPRMTERYTPPAPVYEPTPPEVSEEELEQIRQEAHEMGFRAGFQEGEERAAIEARAKVSAILEELSKIGGELAGMQRSILSHAQENFHTVCKSFIETFLQREFHMNPESFGVILERAVAEGLQDDDYKIFVSSEVAKSLSNWGNEALKSRLRTDDSLNGHDFRVEGQHASLDARLSQMIEELLDQADTQLFDQQDGKVG